MTSRDRELWPNTADPLLTTAAAWFVRVQNDDLDVDEIAEWHLWLAEKPSHREAFDRIQALWESLGQLPDRPLPQLPEHSAAPVPNAHSRWLYTLAASLLIVVGLGTFYALNGRTFWSSTETRVYQTGAGEHREVRLPDGSTLSLGAQSLIWTHFSAGKRELTLERGETFFEVAKDPRRPFVVQAGKATITAVGTAFNVRKTNERVLVAVSEGVVKVTPAAGDGAGSNATVPVSSGTDSGAQSSGATPGNALTMPEQHLRAGQLIVFEPSTHIISVRETPPDAVSAWRNGRLEYLGEPLEYVVDDINRYSNRPIEISDPAIGELLVTGTVFEQDIDAWLQSVEDLLPVSIDRSDPDKIVLTRRVDRR